MFSARTVAKWRYPYWLIDGLTDWLAGWQHWSLILKWSNIYSSTLGNIWFMCPGMGKWIIVSPFSASGMRLQGIEIIHLQSPDSQWQLNRQRQAIRTLYFWEFFMVLLSRKDNFKLIIVVTIWYLLLVIRIIFRTSQQDNWEYLLP